MPRISAVDLSWAVMSRSSFTIRPGVLLKGQVQCLFPLGHGQSSPASSFFGRLPVNFLKFSVEITWSQHRGPSTHP
jgi:hypothetical protein